MVSSHPKICERLQKLNVHKFRHNGDQAQDRILHIFKKQMVINYVHTIHY